MYSVAYELSPRSAVYSYCTERCGVITAAATAAAAAAAATTDCSRQLATTIDAC